jgi:hypothetical protein
MGLGGAVLCFVSLIVLYPIAIAVSVVRDEVAHQARDEANQKAGVARLKALVAAEKRYALANGGFYDRPACLARPRFCIPRYSGAPLLEAEGASLGRRDGYVLLFHPGARPALDVVQQGKVSPASVTDFTFEAVPVEGSASALRLCADARGVICWMDREQQVAGRCPCEITQF